MPECCEQSAIFSLSACFLSFQCGLQVSDLSKELSQLPRFALLAAAFMTYLSRASEDVRHAQTEVWRNKLKLSESFELRSFLSTESEQLIWKAEGLPSDSLSIENALVILKVNCSFMLWTIFISSQNNTLQIIREISFGIFWVLDSVYVFVSCWQSPQCPFLVDPSQRATEWLKCHLKESRLEVINQQV